MRRCGRSERRQPSACGLAAQLELARGWQRGSRSANLPAEPDLSRIALAQDLCSQRINRGES